MRRVAFSTRDLTGSDIAALTGELTLPEAQAQVVESLRAEIASAGAKAPLPLPPQMLLTRTSRAGLDVLGSLAYATPGIANPNAPFSSIEVRMVPENVTNAPRSRSAEGQGASERLVVVRHGQSLEDVLRDNGATREDTRAIVAALGARGGAKPVTEGQKIILQYDDAAEQGRSRRLGRISVYSDEQLKETVAVNDAGAYVPVATPAAAPLARRTERRTTRIPAA